MLRLVLFDMDGVIFQGKNFWLDLHKSMGTEKQAWQLWTGLGSQEYERLSILTAQRLWMGKPTQPFWELVGSRRPVPGIEEVFDYLQKQQIRSAIVSSGPYQLAERARKLFGVDEIRANRLAIGPAGTFTGEVDVQVDENRKDVPARELMYQFQADYDSTAMIGDNSSDVAMASLVSMSIAYDSTDSRLLEACQHELKAGEMGQAVALLARISRHAEY